MEETLKRLDLLIPSHWNLIYISYILMSYCVFFDVKIYYLISKIIATL